VTRPSEYHNKRFDVRRMQRVCGGAQVGVHIPRAVENGPNILVWNAVAEIPAMVWTKDLARLLGHSLAIFRPHYRAETWVQVRAGVCS
jgi:hypothetical protein